MARGMPPTRSARCAVSCEQANVLTAPPSASKVGRHPAQWRMTRVAATRITPPQNDGRASAGFTLVEVLAALAVLGLIIAGLSAGVRFGQQAQLIQARDTMVENQVSPVDATLRSLIAQTWPGAVGAEARFSGTARTLSFRTRMPESLAALRTRDADVSIAVDSAHRLYLTWLPWYRNWIIPRPPPARIDLLANVDHVEFAYWDPGLQPPPGGWVTAWAGTSVPKLLRIRLVFMQDAGLRWPDIIVAPARDPWTF